jgi:phage-related protein
MSLVIYSQGGSMYSRWGIASYVDIAGCQPVLEYMLNEKNPTDTEVIIAVIQRLSSAGLALLDIKMAKHIDGPIYELRKNRHRIMFAEDKAKGCFILLSAFLKVTQKVPPEEVKKAYRFWADYLHTRRFQPFKFPVEDY